MEELNIIEAILSSEFTFGILFIVLAWLVVKGVEKIIRDAKEDGQRREDYIMELHRAREEELKRNIEETKNDSRRREDELMRHLERNTNQQEKIGHTLKDVQSSLEKLEHRMENNFHAVWRQFGKIESKQTKGRDEND
jgi:chromosome segregation ATPase